MADEKVTVEMALGMLVAAPERIATLTAGLSPAQLRAAPAPGDWSPNDVLAHLRACADVWGGCIARILAEDHPTIRAIDPRTWMTRTDYPDLPFAESLHAYAVQRAELIVTLEPLTEEQWARLATMTGSGRPIDRTVLSFARRLAVHERPHIKQIGRAADALRG
jgi:hypothetical protein